MYRRNGKADAQVSPGHAFAWRPDGKEYVTLASGFAVAQLDGAIARHRAMNGYFNSAAWHPRGNLIVIGSGQSTLTGWNAMDLEPNWHAIMLPEKKSATFSAAGELLSGVPKDLDKQLVYYVDRGNGSIEMFAPSEFQKLIPVQANDAASNSR